MDLSKLMEDAVHIRKNLEAGLLLPLTPIE